jgi:hypothetical protein
VIEDPEQARTREHDHESAAAADRDDPLFQDTAGEGGEYSAKNLAAHYAFERGRIFSTFAEGVGKAAVSQALPAPRRYIKRLRTGCGEGSEHGSGGAPGAVGFSLSQGD